jgi:ApaG protein
MTEQQGSEAVTDGIRVEVKPRYMPEHSHPDHHQFLFAYHIMIRNEGSQPAQLLSRRWVVIDADGDHHDVKGPGVVGRMPRLEPGEEFHYVSHCPLQTCWGTMEGSFVMSRDDGERFEASIPRFYLASDSPAAAG